jgi:hypothetical protein
MTEAQATELIALAKNLIEICTFGIGVLFAVIVSGVIKNV